MSHSADDRAMHWEQRALDGRQADAAKKMAAAAKEAELVEAHRSAVRAEMEGWLGDGTEVLWRDERSFDGGSYYKEHVLAVDRDEGRIRVLRAWMSGLQDRPALSVDVEASIADFCGPLEDAQFMHRPGGESPFAEEAFRKALGDEAVEIVWSNVMPGGNGSFVGRSAKPGRAEHVVAAAVLAGPGGPSVDVFRMDLADLEPAAAPAMAR